jgi:hypothetical protein
MILRYSSSKIPLIVHFGAQTTKIGLTSGFLLTGNSAATWEMVAKIQGEIIDGDESNH